jgi:hypothetical protein
MDSKLVANMHAEAATDFYSIKNGSVADVIYHAIQSREDYVKSPWDLVVAGCTYGSTLGMFIFQQLPSSKVSTFLRMSGNVL